MNLNTKAMRRAAIAATAATALVLAGCSSDDNAGSDDNSSAAPAGGRGPITIVEGQDPLNTALESNIADWNADHPDEQVTYKPLATEANDQYDDIAQRMQARSDEYDLIAVDVTNTAEFAANGWLRPLEGDFAIDTEGLLPATVESGTYNGTLYAAPKNTNGAFLYYRTDLVDQAPATWDDLKAECPKAEEAGIACYIGQFKNYEGLTVNVSEFAASRHHTIPILLGELEGTVDEVAVNCHQFAVVTLLEVLPSEVVVLCLGSIGSKHISQNILFSRHIYKIFVKPYCPVFGSRQFVAFEIQKLIGRNIIRQNIAAFSF